MNVPKNAEVVHSSLNGSRPEAESKGSATDLMAKLMGDWSYRPEMQVKDAGHVWTAEQVAALNKLRELPDLELVHTQSVAPKRMGDGPTRVQVLPMRPWSFPAYKGTAVMPPRIGPVMG